jgi:hypothetical protein
MTRRHPPMPRRRATALAKRIAAGAEWPVEAAAGGAVPLADPLAVRVVQREVAKLLTTGEWFTARPLTPSEALAFPCFEPPECQWPTRPWIAVTVPTLEAVAVVGRWLRAQATAEGPEAHWWLSPLVGAAVLEGQRLVRLAALKREVLAGRASSGIRIASNTGQK